jgi:hypothetical protein
VKEQTRRFALATEQAASAVPLAMETTVLLFVEQDRQAAEEWFAWAVGWSFSLWEAENVLTA